MNCKNCDFSINHCGIYVECELTEAFVTEDYYNDVAPIWCPYRESKKFKKDSILYLAGVSNINKNSIVHYCAEKHWQVINPYDLPAVVKPSKAEDIYKAMINAADAVVVIGNTQYTSFEIETAKEAGKEIYYGVIELPCL